MKLPQFNAISSLYKNSSQYNMNVPTNNFHEIEVIPLVHRARPNPILCRGACNCCYRTGMDGCCDKCFDCIE
jgi:hypothetical protein